MSRKASTRWRRVTGISPSEQNVMAVDRSYSVKALRGWIVVSETEYLAIRGHAAYAMK